MNIKPMLMRLQGALGLDDLSGLVLLPGCKQSLIDTSKKRDVINLVVGYDGSPESHTALDLALWIAHQTRLVTPATVIVHAVYVVESEVDEYSGQFNLAWANEHYLPEDHQLKQQVQRTLQTVERELDSARFVQPAPYALTILQQACQLAEEWGGNFDTHLQFGDIVTGLRTVVETEDNVLLVLGCFFPEHPLVQRLQLEVNCPVLGIPSTYFSCAAS